MNLIRGLVAGTLWMTGRVVGGCVALVVLIVIVRWSEASLQQLDLWSDLRGLESVAYPIVPYIPMLLFFTGLVTFAPNGRNSFPKSLALLAVSTLPLSIVLLAIGMGHRRGKGDDHPWFYFSEFLAFLIPLLAASLMMLWYRYKIDHAFNSEPFHADRPEDRLPRTARR